VENSVEFVENFREFVGNFSSLYGIYDCASSCACSGWLGAG
jgi:hypothetical protein